MDRQLDKPGQPVDVWPLWLHIGCVGCAVLVALVLIASAAAYAVYVQHIARSPDPSTVAGRRSPVIAAGDAVVAVILATGYEFEHAAYLQDGHILAVAGPTVSIGGMLAAAFRSAADPERLQEQLVRSFCSRLIQIAPVPLPARATELRLPSLRDGWVDARDFILHPSGGRLALLAGIYSQTIESPDEEFDEIGTGVWALDLRTREWSALARLKGWPRLLAWAENPPVVFFEVEDAGKLLLRAADMDGTVVTLCELPGRTTAAAFDANGSLMLACRTDSDGAREPMTLAVVDPSRGTCRVRPLTTAAGVHPGPLSRNELLLPGRRRSVIALDWKAARLRRITWPSENTIEAKACRAGRWAVATAWPKAATQPRLVAVDLAAGRFYPLSSRPLRLLAVCGDGIRALVCRSSSDNPFASPETSFIAELHIDWDAVEASQGTTDIRRLLNRGGQESTSEQRGES